MFTSLGPCVNVSLGGPSCHAAETWGIAWGIVIEDHRCFFWDVAVWLRIRSRRRSGWWRHEYRTPSHSTDRRGCLRIGLPRVCDTWATVISSCVMQWPPAEQADFSNRCSSSAQKWSSAFGSQFSACISSVDCANLENGDDICFPSSLQAIANGSLDSNIIAGCFRESTDACRMAVAASTPGPSVVSSCLQKWVSCMADPNAFELAFSEDLCLSSLALTPAAQVGVQQCLTQECTSVGACLQNAGAFNW